jgi:hypothetical protein
MNKQPTGQVRGGEPSLRELLDGGDARALAPYGLALPSPKALIHFGSCTANPITPAVMARHRALKHRPITTDPAGYLMTLFGAARCELAASGTDAEYSCALAMGPQPFGSILMDPNEVGSGCTRAAAGLPHAPGGPVTRALPVQARIESTRLRHANGQVMSQADVDQQVYDIASRLRHLPILLHHVACSKTGLCAPSEAACLSVQRGHPAGARVVVDASQGRFQMDDVRRWLSHGWAVIITGSKFFGAPPFCGATLFPAGWAAPQEPALAQAGTGLLARWQLALSAMAAPQAPIDAWQQALELSLISPLRRRASECWFDTGAVTDRQGILSFDLGLDVSASRQLHQALIADGFFIGQPVIAGQRTLLRVALGALTPMGQVDIDLARLARAIQQEMAYG